jgi:ketosteroid isomerase-like protein
MIDELAIQQVINRYSEAASRADWEHVLSTYAPEGVWEIPVLAAKFAGHEAIRQGLITISAPFDYIVQLNAPGVIKLEGDRATARSVMRECGKYSGKDEALEVLLIYDDSLVRTPDGWKFTRRTCEVSGMHTFPVLPARQQ